jgi:DNA repair protein RadC
MEKEKLTKIDIVKIHMVKDGKIKYRTKQIQNPKDLADLGLKFLKHADREIFLLDCLDTRNHINCIHVVSIGTVNASLVAPREVFKIALLSNASEVAFIHNHVSGDVEPSEVIFLSLRDLQSVESSSTSNSWTTSSSQMMVNTKAFWKKGSSNRLKTLKHRKEKSMNVYPEKFLKEYEVKETMFKDKKEHDTKARQLRKDGWEVTTKKYNFDGDERFFLTAIRRKEE